MFPSGLRVALRGSILGGKSLLPRSTSLPAACIRGFAAPVPKKEEKKGKKDSKKWVPPGGFLPAPVIRKADPLPQPPPAPPRPVVTLDAEVRTQTKKYAARALREENRVPCIIFGRGAFDKLLISFDRFELESIWKEGGFCNRVVMIRVPGYPLPFKTIPNQTYQHPVNDMILAATFRRKVARHRIAMPIVIKGESANKAITDGNILIRPLAMLPCYWTGGDLLPEAIVVDITNLRMHGAIHARDLQLPKGLELEPRVVMKPFDWCICSIRLPKKDDVGM